MWKVPKATDYLVVTSFKHISMDPKARYVYTYSNRRMILDLLELFYEGTFVFILVFES